MSYKNYMLSFLGATFLIGAAPVLGMDGLDFDSAPGTPPMQFVRNGFEDEDNVVTYTGDDLEGFMRSLKWSIRSDLDLDLDFDSAPGTPPMQFVRNGFEDEDNVTYTGDDLEDFMRSLNRSIRSDSDFDSDFDSVPETPPIQFVRGDLEDDVVTYTGDDLAGFMRSLNQSIPVSGEDLRDDPDFQEALEQMYTFPIHISDKEYDK